MTAFRTAEPKAPPIARAEKARPVAVERKAWGAVNWTTATSSVTFRFCQTPAALVGGW